jgi:hypothetical protein
LPAGLAQVLVAGQLYPRAQNTLWTRSLSIYLPEPAMAGGMFMFIRLIAVLISIFLSSALAYADPSGAKAGSAGAKKELARTPHQGPAGIAQIYVYWHGDSLEPGWVQSLSRGILPDMEVHVDDQKIGGILVGQYITAKVPTGNHTFAFKAGFFSLPMMTTTINVAGTGTHYYRIYRVFPRNDPDAVRLYLEEAPEARALQEMKELQKR